MTGGKTTKEATKRVLQQVLTDGCARGFNFRGKGRKRAFGDLSLSKVVCSKCWALRFCTLNALAIIYFPNVNVFMKAPPCDVHAHRVVCYRYSATYRYCLGSPDMQCVLWKWLILGCSGSSPAQTIHVSYHLDERGITTKIVHFRLWRYVYSCYCANISIFVLLWIPTSLVRWSWTLT